MVNKSLNLITLAKQNISCRIPMMYSTKIVIIMDYKSYFETGLMISFGYLYDQRCKFLLLSHFAILVNKWHEINTLEGWILDFHGWQPELQKTNHRTWFEQYFWMMSSFTQSCSRTMIMIFYFHSFFQCCLA